MENDKQRENAYLVDLILAKGDIDKVRFETAQDKVNFLLNFKLQDKYKNLQLAKVETMYETDAQSNANKTILLNSIKTDISRTAEETLKSRDIDVPLLLSETQKEKNIADALKNLGLEQQDIDGVLKNGVKNAETINGENITLTFDNNDKIKEVLEKNDVVYKQTNKGLEVDAKLVAQEGIEVENDKKTKKYLEDNQITHYIQPDDPRKIFVPLRAKKVATLLAASVIITPVPALALQIILNKFGLLDKMIENHVITRKQKQALNNGQTVLVKQKIEGKDVEQYMFKGQDGTIKKLNKEDVQIPNKLNGAQLSPEQKATLREGRSIEILTDGKKKGYVLDLTKQNGVREVNLTPKKDINDWHTPSPSSSDKEKMEYISKNGPASINDIYGNNPVNSQRDSFLDKYNLRNEYKDYTNAEKAVKIAEISGNPTAILVAKLAEKVEKFKSTAVDLALGMDEKQNRGYRR